MEKYEIHVTSRDMLGLNFFDNVVALSAKGAVLKEGTLPFLKFPFSVVMTLESDEEPLADPYHRVFTSDKKEIKPKPFIVKDDQVFVSQAVIEPATFSMEAAVTKEKLTKEALEALTWDEFREECKVYGISGRDKKVMTTKYLDK